MELKRAVFRGTAGSLLIVICSIPCAAAQLTTDLDAALHVAAPADELAIIVTLSDQVDVRTFYAGRKAQRRSALIEALRTKAAQTQAPLVALLRQRKARHLHPLWIQNAIALRATADVVRWLTTYPGIARIALDATLSVPEALPSASTTPESNLDAIGAPGLWALGYTGSGTVVANMDTGVDLYHPDVSPRWRGGANSWFDPNGEHPTPADVHGHGTWTMGLMVGGAAGGTSIGVTPGSEWIAVKIFNDAGAASLSAIHQGFQWILDPDDNPDTDDAPDVVNNSWGLNNRIGDCVLEFEPDVAALEAAGIAVVFSAGNAGPAPSTSTSPANYAGSIAVGAIDEVGTVASFSSRGPSACNGDIYPRLVAPGVNVKTSDLTFGGALPNSYMRVSGTSFAAPHVAGGLALLRQAFPAAALWELETAMEETATDLGANGPDNTSGYGLLDLPAAYSWLADLHVREVRVAAGADDAEERASGTMKLTSSDLELVHDRDDQTVGIRFAGVEIPAGALISQAYVQFQVDETSSGSTALTIWGEGVGDALAFRGSSGDITGRERTVASVDWVPPAWPAVREAAAAQQTPDLRPVLQEIVDRGDWVAGNALVLIIAGSGKRVAESYDGDAAGAPLLHVEYRMLPSGSSTTTSTTTTSSTTMSTATTTVPVTTTTSTTMLPTTTTTSPPLTTTTTTTASPGTTTTTTTASTTTTTVPPATGTLAIPVRTRSDDAEEQPGGSMDLTSSDLEMVYEKRLQKVGMRFTGVTIPTGATITHAYVQFHVDEKASDPAKLWIQGQDHGNPPTFTSTSGDISARTPTGTVVEWLPAPWDGNVGDAGVAQQTPEIKAVIQEIVSRGDWAGDALVILITGTSTSRATSRTAQSYDRDKDPTRSPILHVEYAIGATTTTTSSTSTTAVPTTTTTSSTPTTAVPTTTTTSSTSTTTVPTTTTTSSTSTTTVPTTTTTSSTSTTAVPTTTTTSSTMPPGPVYAEVIADVRTEKKNPNTQFGAEPVLSVDADSEKNTFIRIRVDGIGGRTVTRAVVELTVAGNNSASSDSGGRIQPIADCGWDERTVTFNDSPSLEMPIGGTVGDDVGPVRQGQVVAFPVGIRADGLHCFAITSDSSNGADYFAREASANGPQVIVEVAAQ